MDHGPEPAASSASGEGFRFPSFPVTPSANTLPGWYADPWGVAAFRFWDGAVWSTNVARRRRSMRVARIARVAFILASIGSGLYLILLIFIFPLLVLGDSDNGCLAHDFTHFWLPLVATCSIATTSCVTMAVIGIERRSRWWVLLPVSCVAAAVVCLIAAPTVSTCS